MERGAAHGKIDYWKNSEQKQRWLWRGPASTSSRALRRVRVTSISGAASRLLAHKQRRKWSGQ